MTKKRDPTLPRSIALFRDVEEILETVFAYDDWPYVIELHDPRKAIRWCQRANTYRAILREHEEYRLTLPPGTGSSKFDGLAFRVKDTGVEIGPRTTSGATIIDKRGLTVTPLNPALTTFIEESSDGDPDDNTPAIGDD